MFLRSSDIILSTQKNTPPSNRDYRSVHTYAYEKNNRIFQMFRSYRHGEIELTSSIQDQTGHVIIIN